MVVAFSIGPLFRVSSDIKESDAEIEAAIEPMRLTASNGSRIIFDPRINLAALSFAKFADANELYDANIPYVKRAFDILESTNCTFVESIKEISLSDQFMEKWALSTEFMIDKDAIYQVMKESGMSLDSRSRYEFAETFRYELDQYMESVNYRFFLEENRDFHVELLHAVNSILEANDVDAHVVDFYGESFDKTNMSIAIVPYIDMAWISVDEEIKPGVKWIYMLIDPMSSESDFLIDYIHESSHVLIDHYVTSSLDLVNKSSWRQIDFGKGIQAKIYSDWETQLKEYIVRANTITIIGNILGDIKKRELEDIEIRSGFTSIHEAVKLTDYYISHRDQYHSFKEFIPFFLESFSEK